MQLKLIRHLWGVTGTWEELFPRIAADGFEGIETGLPPAGDVPRLRRLLGEHQFAYIPQIFTGGSNVREHAASLLEQVQRTAALNPLLINCHGGRDAWTLAESLDFYGRAVEIEKSLGLPIAHETHRGRAFFTPWATAAVLKELPNLHLCCDYSHWVCVCERLLDDCEPILRLAARHCIHLHARVGYEEGPQVPDPSAPESRRHLEAHEAWWRMIWDEQKRSGIAQTTLTPEFGPPGYLHTLPHTNVPVADLWRVCKWQADRQRETFRAWLSARK